MAQREIEAASPSDKRLSDFECLSAAPRLDVQVAGETEGAANIPARAVRVSDSPPGPVRATRSNTGEAAGPSRPIGAP